MTQFLKVRYLSLIVLFVLSSCSVSHIGTSIDKNTYGIVGVTLTETTVTYKMVGGETRTIGYEDENYWRKYKQKAIIKKR